jgi:type I restriction enzyme S subunit
MWFEFPESWALASFEELFVIVSGVTKGQKVAANDAVDAPYLRVANVQRGYLDLSVIKKLTVRKADEKRYALRLGDVLMTEGGDWDNAFFSRSNNSDAGSSFGSCGTSLPRTARLRMV